MNRILRGTFSALYTPFTADGAVDSEALNALCHRLLSAGVCLVPCGTTGETPTLTPQEYRQVVEIAVAAADGDSPVIAGTGSNHTAGTIAQTRLAKEMGASAALVVVPYYNKPPQRSLVAHFTAVAEEGGLPVVLYNVPGRTGCNMNAETTLELSEHPNIVAVKEASANLDQIQEVICHAPEGFSVLSGDDAWTLPMLLLGAHGVVSVAANVAPSAVVALVQAGLAGDLDAARTIQRTLLDLFSTLFCTTNPIPVKYAAAHLGHCLPGVRLPLTADVMDDALMAPLRRALDKAMSLQQTLL